MKLRITGNNIIKYSSELYKGFYPYEIDEILDNLEIIKVIEGMRGRGGYPPIKRETAIDGYELIVNFKNKLYE